MRLIVDTCCMRLPLLVLKPFAHEKKKIRDSLSLPDLSIELQQRTRVNNKRYDKFCVIQNTYITTKIVFFPSSHSLISIEKNRASYDASIPLPFQRLSFRIVARLENERVKSTRRKDAAVYARGAKLSRFDIDTPSRKGNFSSRIHDYRVNVAPAGCSRQRGRATIRARGYSTPFPSHRRGAQAACTTAGWLKASTARYLADKQILMSKTVRPNCIMAFPRILRASNLSVPPPGNPPLPQPQRLHPAIAIHSLYRTNTRPPRNGRP